MMRRTSVGILVGAIALFATASQSRANIVQITDESQLNVDLTIDWGNLGPKGTELPDGTTFHIPPDATLQATITNNGADGFIRFDQGTDPNDEFNGSFDPGTELLGNEVNTVNGISFSFNEVIQGFGTLLQASEIGAYTVSIEAFDALNNSLGLFTYPTVNDPNDLLFVGLRDDAGATISRIMITNDTDGTNFDAFFMAGPVIELGRPIQVPEPSSLALLGLTLAGLGMRSARRNRIRRAERG